MKDIIKFKGGWIRDKRQEDINVYRWYENPKKGYIASIVKGYFPDELNYRVSTKHDSSEIRGHKSIIMKFSDEKNLGIIKRRIEEMIKYPQG